MDYLFFLLPIALGLLSFIHWYRHSPKLPTSGAIGKLSGTRFVGFVRIDNDPQLVDFIVGEKQLGVVGGLPSFSLLLDIHELELTKKYGLFGSKVKIISHDFYTDHLFKELIVSNRVARRLKIYSNGKLTY
ncbi:hypothetical protein [Enterovibrio calviensis]|uniref:hypothetical protein n=1 Tax=Enterovibrio calviensis TaxID=91359 RepID=UPI0037355F1B